MQHLILNIFQYDIIQLIYEITRKLASNLEITACQLNWASKSNKTVVMT